MQVEYINIDEFDFNTSKILPISSQFNENGINELIEYSKLNKNSMPFYTLTEKQSRDIHLTSENAYDALCEALQQCFNNTELFEKFFGDIIKDYPDFVDLAKYTWDNDHSALYGRFDMSYDVDNNKVGGIYEFNGNTPVMLFESVYLQDEFFKIAQKQSYSNIKQSNEYFNNLSKSIKNIVSSKQPNTTFNVYCDSSFPEDLATCETINNIISENYQVFPYLDDLENLGFENNRFVSLSNDQFVENMFILKPWEDLFMDDELYDKYFKDGAWTNWVNDTRFFEPAWRWFISNKRMMAVVTYLVENDEHFQRIYGNIPFLRTYLSKEECIANDIVDYVEKPVIGRLSNNISIYKNDVLDFQSDGFYDDSPMVYQEYCAPQKIGDRNNSILCTWLSPFESENVPLIMESSNICFREFDNPVLSIKNERFIPHFIKK